VRWTRTAELVRSGADTSDRLPSLGAPATAVFQRRPAVGGSACEVEGSRVQTLPTAMLRFQQDSLGGGEPLLEWQMVCQSMGISVYSSLYPHLTTVLASSSLQHKEDRLL